MARSRVRIGGDVVEVEHASGIPPEEIKALARRQATTQSLARREPTTRSEGLDAVGRAKRWLVRREQDVPAEQQRLPGQIIRAAGDLFIPESLPDLARTVTTLPIGGGMVTGPLKRVAAGALASGGARLAESGGDYWAAGKEAVGSGLSQFAGELLPGALRFGATQRAARAPLAKAAHDRAMHETLTEADRTAHTEALAATGAADTARATAARAQHTDIERTVKLGHKNLEVARKSRHAADVEAATQAHAAQVRAYEERGATTIMDAIKSHVPALADMPSNERGLLDTVYGKGQRLVSAKYDEAVREMVAAGRGRATQLPLKDARALGIRAWDVTEQERGRPIARVDAGQLAEAILGVWKRDPGLYRRGVASLDALGIGDPVARGEYKAFQALVQFSDKSGMLRGEKFNADKALAGFTKLKQVDELRRRGGGNIFEGPVSEAVRTRPPGPLTLPPEPRPLAPPRIPAYRAPAASPSPAAPPQRQAPPTAKDLGVETATVPEVGFFAGAMLAEVPFLLGGLAMGHQGYHGYGLPAVAGGLTARGLGGRTFATKAPLTPATSRALDLLPPALAQETSSLTRGRRPQPLTITPGSVTPETQREAQEYYDRQQRPRPEDPSAP